MLDEKDLLQDDDLNPEDIQESLDNPALLEKDVPVIELLEEEVALETLVEADDYSGMTTS